jgi:hypothetical protein
MDVDHDALLLVLEIERGAASPEFKGSAAV